MNEREFKRWKKIRQKGRLRYIILYGILLFGIPFGIFTVLLNSIVHSPLTDMMNIKGMIGIFLAGGFYGIFLGILIGIIFWRRNEEKWKKSTFITLNR